MHKWKYYFYDYSEPAIEIETKEKDRLEADKILLEKYGKKIVKRVHRKKVLKKAVKSEIVRCCYYLGEKQVKKTYKKSVKKEDENK